MTRVGITGHVDLAPQTVPLVRAALLALLAEVDRPLVGVTCLAPGADQVFAEVVLDLAGSIEVVLPAADYRDRKVGPAQRGRFDRLLARAEVVRTMPYQRADRAAYRAAGEALLGVVNRLIAVWDGESSGSPGGTADLVHSARHRGVPITVVWPAGASRG